MKKHYCYLGLCDVEFGMTKNDILAIAKSGDNEPAVRLVSQKHYIRKQLDAISTEDMEKVYEDYTGEEPQMDRPSLERFLVWTAAWDLFEML